MIPYPFIVNGTSFAALVSRYSYQTDRIPVETERITTMDGVDHVAVKRYKGILRVGINPQDETLFNQFCEVLESGILTVYYRCLQTKTNVTQSMTVSGMPGRLVITNRNRNLVGDLSLNFTQL